MHKKEEIGSAAARSPLSREKGKWFKHTPESDQRIRDGCAVNERISDIAKAIGTNRNVVIGRANRLGLASKARWLVSGRHISTTMKQWYSDHPEAKDMLREPSRLNLLHEGRDRYWEKKRAQ